MRLTIGSDLITATARDAAGQTASDQIEVFYQPSLAHAVLFEYDNNGCLVRKTVRVEGLPDEVTEYHWDFEHRLVRASLSTILLA